MTDEETKTTETTESTNTPVVENSGTSLADRAFEAANAAEKATEHLKTENDRKEALMAREALAGKSDAGSGNSPKTQDELDEDAAKLFMTDDE